MSRKAQQAGATFEEFINFTNHLYLKRGIARIDKIPTPTRFSHGKTIYHKKSIADFVGVAGGRMIAFEAKCSADNRFYKSKILAHQIEYLVNVKMHGGIAFLLIYMKMYNRVFVVPITDFWLTKIWLNTNKASMTLDDLLEHGLEIVGWDQGRGGIPLDYLGVLKK